MNPNQPLKRLHLYNKITLRRFTGLIAISIAIISLSTAGIIFMSIDTPRGTDNQEEWGLDFYEGLVFFSTLFSGLIAGFTGIALFFPGRKSSLVVIFKNGIYIGPFRSLSYGEEVKIIPWKEIKLISTRSIDNRKFEMKISFISKPDNDLIIGEKDSTMKELKKYIPKQKYQIDK